MDNKFHTSVTLWRREVYLNWTDGSHYMFC